MMAAGSIGLWKGVACVVAEGGRAAAMAAAEGVGAVGCGEWGASGAGLSAGQPDDWAALAAGEYRERKKKAGFLVGEGRKATRGRADGRAGNELLARRAAG